MERERKREEKWHSRRKQGSERKRMREGAVVFAVSQPGERKKRRREEKRGARAREGHNTERMEGEVIDTLTSCSARVQVRERVCVRV